ncbi:MAG: hypothetical protein LBD78_09120 [Spirochaetaceae bacterium]|jgi:hypothetical protein|nr:hypothetical protein [Spirochaetaceae bacterium]
MLAHYGDGIRSIVPENRTDSQNLFFVSAAYLWNFSGNSLQTGKQGAKVYLQGYPQENRGALFIYPPTANKGEGDGMI